MMKSQDIINTGLYVWVDLGKKEKEIAKKLNISSSKLSALKTIKGRRGEYIAKGNYPNREGLEKYAIKIRQILEGEGVVIKEDIESGKFYFKNTNTGKKWDVIDAVSQSVILSNAEIRSNLEYLDIVEILKNSNANEIWILQTYFTHIELSINLFEYILKKNPNCKIKILLFDANSNSIRARAKGIAEKLSILGEKLGVEGKVYNNIVKLDGLQKRYPDQIEYACYDGNSLFNFYRYDDQILIGFQWFNKFVIDGCFFEMKYDESHPFIRDVTSHWNSIWEYVRSGDSSYDIEYICHVVIEGRKKEMSLKLNFRNKDVILEGTSSGKKYKGSIVNLNGGYCSINLLSEKDLDSDAFHSFFILLHLDYQEIKIVEIATGFLCVNSPREKGNIYSRNILLENKSNFKEIDDKEQLILEFLKRKDIINSYAKISTWRGLRDRSLEVIK